MSEPGLDTAPTAYKHPRDGVKRGEATVFPAVRVVILPETLAQWAEHLGWTRQEAYGRHANIWRHPDHPVIKVPTHDRVADYSSVVWDLLGDFARAAGKSIGDVMREMSTDAPRVI